MSLNFGMKSRDIEDFIDPYESRESISSHDDLFFITWYMYE